MKNNWFTQTFRVVLSISFIFVQTGPGLAAGSGIMRTGEQNLRPYARNFSNDLESYSVDKLTAGDGAAADKFGTSVARDGDLLVVGAQFADVEGHVDQGAVYVYDCSLSPCVQREQLLAFDGAAGDNFGNSVTLENGLLIVGAVAKGGTYPQEGAAYVFDCNASSCTETDKLVSSTPYEGGRFGISVVVKNNIVVVGADHEDYDNGAAYVFDCSIHSNCLQKIRLAAPDYWINRWFGTHMAIDGTLIVVGAFAEDIEDRQDQGSAYVFRCNATFSDCSTYTKLIAADGVALANFGLRVAVAGDVVFVGARGDMVGGNDKQGSVYVYTCSAFPCAAPNKLTASDGAANDYFGLGLALRGSTLVVGASQDDIGGNANQGSAYVFTCAGATCTQQDHLTASDGEAGDNFGSAIALSETQVIIGALSDDIGSNPDQGSVYTFDVNTPPVIMEGNTISPDPFNLILHATDANADTLTWSVSSPASHGTAIASGTGYSKIINYTADTNYVGQDSFVVQVDDGNGGTDAITVNVTVHGNPPIAVAFISQNGVTGFHWPEGAQVTLTITGPGPDYNETQTSVANTTDPWDTTSTKVDFRLTGFTLLPGQVLSMSDSVTTKTLAVSSLTLGGGNANNGTIWGTAEPGAVIEIAKQTDHNIFRRETADVLGNWQADFSAQGDETGENPYTFQPSNVFIVLQMDVDGDHTQIDWRVPNPFIEANPVSNWVHGRDWPSGAQLTLTIDDPTNGVGVDKTVHASMGQNPWNLGDPNDILADFSLDGFDLKSDQILKITDGTTERTYTPTDLAITSIDVFADTISGIATSGVEVQVCANTPGNCVSRYVIPDGSGHWTADYAHPGTRDDEGQLLDLEPGKDGWAAEREENGNQTWADWRVLNPFIIAKPDTDWIGAFDWPDGSLLTLTIDDPSNGVGVDKTANATTGPAYWDPNQLVASFGPDGFDIQPGQLLKITDGTTERTYTPTDLVITSFDLDADTISGIAAPGVEVQVCVNVPGNCILRYVTADGAGHWTADYGHPGARNDERQLVDLQFGKDGSVYQNDANGNRTTEDWTAEPGYAHPDFSADFSNNRLNGYNWPLGASITLSIDDLGTPGSPDYTATPQTVGGSSEHTSILFDLDGHIQLEPGQVVSMSDGTTTETHTLTELSKLSVGFIQLGFENWWRGANTASFAETAEQQGIPLKFYNGQHRQANQISAFNQLIQDPDVNVIVLDATVSTGWDEVLQAAQAAGKVIILEDSSIDALDSLYTSYVLPDFIDEGRKAGTEMCSMLAGNPSKNVVELVGSIGSQAAQKRGQGFRQITDACGITITQSKTANWNFTEGKAVMSAWLQASADIQGVFAQNSEMGLGAIQAIKDASRAPGVDIKVVSIDAESAAFTALSAGELNAIIECNPRLAPTVYEAALQAINGQTVPKTIFVQGGVFHAANDLPEITEGASAAVTISKNGSPTPFSLTLHATDLNNDPLTWSISTPAGHGTARVSGKGTSKAISYIPDTDYVGSDSFAAQVSDGKGGTDTIIVSVTIIDITPIVNQTPSVALVNTTASLPENADTSGAIKVADITVTDDGLGTNILSLSGADAAMFQIVGSQLRLKAGAALDFETNPVLNVTVAVDDSSVGATPDDMASLTINLIDIDEIPPSVISSVGTDTSPTSAANVHFRVTFSEAVMGVNTSVPFNDFSLTTTGITGASITSVSGSGTTYTVTVSTGFGNGTIRLNVIDGDSIQDASGNPLGGAGANNGNFMVGQTYTVNKIITLNSIGANDGWILESSETSNKGGTLNIIANIFNLGDDAANKQFLGILHFNTVLPSGAVITAVTLKIKQSGLVGTNPFKTHGDLLVDIRQRYFGTTAGLVISDFQAAPSKSAVATFGKTPTSNWYSAVLNSTAISFINHAGTTQFRLRFTKDDNNDRGADYMTFFSGNAPIASRPQLVITYYIP